MSDLVEKNSSAVATAAELETIHCLLLPLNKEIAILPNAAVAEIIPFSEPEAMEGAPDWLLGRLTWRERKIPLISFETVSGSDTANVHPGCRIAILNTLNGNSRLPYVAIVLQSLPSLQVIREQNIQYEERQDLNRQSVKAYVDLNGTIAMIPDIDDIEARLSAIQN